jgi:hypothetical protein
MHSRILYRTLAVMALLCGSLLLTACGGGGGGGGNNGGGTGTPVTVVGSILRAETNAPPNPVATIKIGTASVQTASDGTFTLANAPSDATTLTITAQGSQTLTQAVKLTAGQTNNLGTIFISDTGYNATVTGRVISSATNQPVANATVILTGLQTTTSAQGTFTLSNLPVGLGNVSGTYGKISAGTAFADKPITAEVLAFPLEAGNNPLGDIALAPPVGDTPPGIPYTITGRITANGQTPTSSFVVALSLNGNVLPGQVQTDSAGNYFFWVASSPTDYTILVPAQNGYTAGQTTAALRQNDTPITAQTINVTK